MSLCHTEIRQAVRAYRLRSNITNTHTIADSTMTEAPGLFLDFETASTCDLRLHGLARYLAAPTTRAYCFTFALPGMRTADLWESGKPIPRQLADHIAAGRPFRAHNAGFDFHVWNEVLRRDLPDLPVLAARQVQCSAARARYNGLPGSLAKACDALGLPIRKDAAGGKVMLSVATHPDWTPADHPAEFARVYEYALTDTNAMMALWDATQPMPEQEQRYWQLDLEINTRGLGCDVEAAAGMEEMHKLALALIDFELAAATDGKLLAASEVQKIRAFAAGLGEDMDDAGRETVKHLLEKPDMPAALRDVLALRLDASRAPKKAAAILRAHVNGRMCHSTVYHGALSGRSTAMGCGDAQLLNVARPRPGRKPDVCESYLEAARRRDFDFLSRPEVGPPLAALADAQRALFCATEPDHVLVCADLSGIEARLGPWCANDEGMLVEFEQGIDGYVVEASTAFKKPMESVTKDERQIGKVCFEADTEVLTSEGWVRIVDVKPHQLLWDGEEWVSHGGVIANGSRETIDFEGVRCTSDHPFWTGSEWKSPHEMTAEHRQSVLETGAEALRLAETSNTREVRGE